MVSIYAFSIENFKRSKFEVDALMEMAKMKCAQLAQHGDLLDQCGARVRVLGRLDLLRPDVLAAVNRLVQLTSKNGERILNVCFPYTSRDEITTAIRETVAEYSRPVEQPSSSSRTPFSESRIALNIQAQAEGAKMSHVTNGNGDNKSGILSKDDEAKSSSTPVFISPETITSKTLTDHMFTSGSPPLDLLIRTSSVGRLSDFMLWQCHEHTEIVFLDVMWPEFDLWHFLPVLLRWQRRITRTRKNNDGDEVEGLYYPSSTSNGSLEASHTHANGKVKSS